MKAESKKEERKKVKVAKYKRYCVCIERLLCGPDRRAACFTVPAVCVANGQHQQW